MNKIYIEKSFDNMSNRERCQTILNNFDEIQLVKVIEFLERFKEDLENMKAK